jgi:AraC-like DNA-binding protein
LIFVILAEYKLFGIDLEQEAFNMDLSISKYLEDKVKFLSIIFLLILSYSCNKTHLPSDMIQIPYTNRNIKIDGDLGEWKTRYMTVFEDTLQWINSPNSYSIEEVYPDGFDINQVLPPLSRNEVTAMICWDKNAIYLGLLVMDKHLVAEIEGKKDNPKIFLNDGIEFYIDTKNDSRERMDINDYHFIVDLLNQHCIFRGDLQLLSKDRQLVPQQIGQNIIFESAVKYNGIINHTKVGNHYVVEVRVPFLSLGMRPFDDKDIRIDICANDADYLLSELDLKKEELHFTWAFNWSGLGDFGFPDTWKRAELVGKPSAFHLLADKYKYSWIYFFGGFVFISSFIGFLLIRKIRKLRKLPDAEKINNIMIINNPGTKQKVDHEFNGLLSEVTQYIYLNISDKITPKEVASKKNISLRTLERLTKSELDCTPVALINSVKLKYAKEVLQKNKRISISELAYETGFRLFKNHFGVSPKKFLLIVTENQEIKT